MQILLKIIIMFVDNQINKTLKGYEHEVSARWIMKITFKKDWQGKTSNKVKAFHFLNNIILIVHMY
jgi:uncharacterized protein YbcI